MSSLNTEGPSRRVEDVREDQDDEAEDGSGSIVISAQMCSN